MSGGVAAAARCLLLLLLLDGSDFKGWGGVCVSVIVVPCDATRRLNATRQLTAIKKDGLLRLIMPHSFKSDVCYVVNHLVEVLTVVPAYVVVVVRAD